MPKTTDKFGVDLAVRRLSEYGVLDWVFSPGSRNAPMVLAVRALAEARIEVVVDERSAAFTALGMSLATGRPVVLCCTSGSAVANYAPAVVEAFYQGIPLILLTADRPAHRIDQFEGQTIRQQGIFGTHVLYEAVLNEQCTSASERAGQERHLAEAFRAAMSGGPVHLNLPLSEPLYQTVPVAALPRLRIEYTQGISKLSDDHMQSLVSELCSFQRILVIVGSHRSRSPRRTALLKKLLEHPGVYLLGESLSNLDAELGSAHIDRIVLTLSPEERELLRPGAVLAMGGELVSRKLKLWLRESEGWSYWQIGRPLPGSRQVPDPMERLHRGIEVDPEDFLEAVLAHPAWNPTSVHSDYSALWQRAAYRRSQAHTEFLKQAPWSDLTAFDRIVQTLPAHAHVWEGNSSPIRYVQLCPARTDLTHWANRGSSGIDGLTSTAVGFARRTGGPVFLLSGELSFFYDSNAFWQADLPKQLKVVVINNGGGGIFRIIDGPAGSGWLEPHFEAGPQRSVEALCAQFGLAYFRASDPDSLNKALAEWLNFEGLSVLEVVTPKHQNPEVLKAYFETLSHV
ncbi:2-succinyl-5-enolpyruvyl-6-hydroxy-3-cyclohexene-1-carboxylic-acid synthase [bacterium]|nr:2-succinyl-5-enolpyruvyl-6-hydroxy-3-cyclohexene-1-carboxylic-acid synthase [bacterium]